VQLRIQFLLLSVSAIAVASDEGAIRQVIRDLVAADNARDLAGAMSHYTEDAILLPPGLPAIAGKTAIRERYRGLYANALPDLNQQIEEVVVSNDWAYVRGRTSGRFPQGPNQPARNIDDKFIMILKHEKGGWWRIARLMWNPSGRAD
jgi:uncharacterized protein (TIGR02246 family)